MICWLSQGTRSDSSHKGTCVVCFHLGVTSWQILSDGKPDTIHVGFFAYSLLTQYHLHYVKHRSSSCTKHTGHWSSFCLQASPLLGGSVSPAPPLPRVNVTEEQRAQLSVPIVIKGLRCPGPGKGTNPSSWESPSISLYQERVFFLPWPPLFFIHIPRLAQSWNFLGSEIFLTRWVSGGPSWSGFYRVVIGKIFISSHPREKGQEDVVREPTSRRIWRRTQQQQAGFK